VKRFVSLKFLNLRNSVGLFGLVISPSQGRYLTQKQNKHKQTSMPRVEFEIKIAAFERAKTVHALYLAPSVRGINLLRENVNTIKAQQCSKEVNLSLILTRNMVEIEVIYFPPAKENSSQRYLKLVFISCLLNAGKSCPCA
jgi:hypothetical protein